MDSLKSTIIRLKTIIHSHGPDVSEVRFTSFLSGGFTTMAVRNPPEKKLEKRTFVHCVAYLCAGVVVGLQTRVIIKIHSFYAINLDGFSWG